MAKRKPLTASEVSQLAVMAWGRSFYGRLQTGEQLPALADIVIEIGQRMAGEIVAAQTEPDEPAPDTERRPFIDTEGRAL